MSSKGQSYDPKSTAEQLIERAQERCHQAREEFLQSRYFNNGVERATLLQFHFATMAYYEELRPLRDKNNVNGWWENVELYQQPAGKQLVDPDGNALEIVDHDSNGRPVAVAYPDGSDQFDPRAVGAEWQRVYESVTGLDTLQTLFHQQSVAETDVSNSFGNAVETQQQYDPLSGDQLLGISRALDDAAEKLDFGPDVDDGFDVYGVDPDYEADTDDSTTD